MSDQARRLRSYVEPDEDLFDDERARQAAARSTRARQAALAALERELSEFLQAAR